MEMGETVFFSAVSSCTVYCLLKLVIIFCFRFVENVITPLQSWRNMVRLRSANLSLKCKKRIKKQYQVRNSRINLYAVNKIYLMFFINFSETTSFKTRPMQSIVLEITKTSMVTSFRMFCIVSQYQ